MNAPTLVIMAAGMGSRYGGLKQIDPVDKHGNQSRVQEGDFHHKEREP